MNDDDKNSVLALENFLKKTKGNKIEIKQPIKKLKINRRILISQKPIKIKIIVFIIMIIILIIIILLIIITKKKMALAITKNI